MNYKRIYDNLIETRRYRVLDDNIYTELHHINPKFSGGGDNKDNIIKLTAREHFIAHALLAHIYKNTEYATKASCAFRFMYIMSDSNKERYISTNSYTYALSRKFFVDNHPCKSEDVKAKISNSLRRYFGSENFKLDLLRRRIKKGMLEIEEGYNLEDYLWVHDHDGQEYTCACGCGEVFRKTYFSKQKYIQGHSQKCLIVTDEHKNKTSNSLKRHLGNLTKDELSSRMKNSTGNCDHVARGKAISESKKGKPTNQKYKTCIRYGEMNENEFQEYIAGRRIHIQERMIKMRGEYFDGTYKTYKI